MVVRGNDEEPEDRNGAAGADGGQVLIQEYQQNDRGRNPEQPGKGLPKPGGTGTDCGGTVRTGRGLRFETQNFRGRTG